MFKRNDISTHHAAINEIILKYCEENGLVFDPKTISYTENEIDYKCTIRATDAAGNVALIRGTSWQPIPSSRTPRRK